tara:strand:- start:1034 stop:2917 length:1884 start_codon:yes stop_codon:yes gene_type:complete
MVEIEQLLSNVTRPGRYSGGEWNSVTKSWSTNNHRVALAYPDVYDIGMSNMGLGILYDLLNQQSDVLCERVFTPWLDMQSQMRSQGIPLWSLENRRPIRDFDILGFTLQYELTFTNVLTMLDLAQIPIYSKERTNDDPLVIAGGSAAFNPEPLAPFIDAFVLGEGEDVILEISDLLRQWKKSSMPREERLKDLLLVPGVYVPAFYDPKYNDEGHFIGLEPLHPNASEKIKRRVVDVLPPPLTQPIVPFLQTVHDRAAVEIQRGCTQGCRFCQAGMIYRPTRERSPEEVVKATESLLKNTGYDELSLLSLSTTDHSRIVPMVEALTAKFPELKISLPSTRVDSFSVDVANAVAKGKKHTLTLAPEAGSQRLRNAINKLVTEDDLLGAATNAFSRGWTSVKMYYMVGLPSETINDVEGILDMGIRVKRIGRDLIGKRAKVRVSTSNHVPKPHAPFQWAKQETADELSPKHVLLKDGCRKAGIEFSWNDPADSFVEAVLSRGDRRVAEAVFHAWQRGATFDAWSESFSPKLWDAAFSDAELDPSWYAHREWDTFEPLPWDHIESGVSKAYLRGQWMDVFREHNVGDCHHGGCNVCGLQNVPVADCVSKLGDLIAEKKSKKFSDHEFLELV